VHLVSCYTDNAFIFIIKQRKKINFKYFFTLKK